MINEIKTEQKKKRRRRKRPKKKAGLKLTNKSDLHSPSSKAESLKNMVSKIEKLKNIVPKRHNLKNLVSKTENLKNIMSKTFTSQFSKSPLRSFNKGHPRIHLNASENSLHSLFLKSWAPFLY